MHSRNERAMQFLRYFFMAFVAMAILAATLSMPSVQAANGATQSLSAAGQHPTTTESHRRTTKPINRHPVFLPARHIMCTNSATCSSNPCSGRGTCSICYKGPGCYGPTPATPTPTPASCVYNSITSPGAQALTGNVAPGGITGSFTDTCTNGHTYTIEFNAGLHGVDGTTPTRNIQNAGGQQIQYQIFRDSGHTQPWGDTVGTNTTAATGTGAAQSWTFYVQISTPPMTIPAGSYTDTVTTTISF